MLVGRPLRSCAIALSLVVAGGAEPASGVDVEGVTLTAAGGAVFDPGMGNGCGDLPVGYSPVVDGALNGDADAFDGGMIFGVGPKAYSATKGAVEGQTLSTGPRRLKGLVVSRSDAALATEPAIRSLIKLSNPSPRGLRRDVILLSNLGSDDQTLVRDSESGSPGVLETTDGWLVTADDAADVNLDDPVVLTVLHGPGTFPAREAEMGSGCPLFRWNVRVPKHGSRYLLFFSEMHPTAAAASTAADGYVSLDRAHLRGIEESKREAILNWAL